MQRNYFILGLITLFGAIVSSIVFLQLRSAQPKLLVSQSSAVSWYGGKLETRIGEQPLQLPQNVTNKVLYLTQNDENGKLKFFDVYIPDMKDSVRLDATGTARGLILLTPVFSHVSTEEKAKLLNSIQQHPKFSELVDIVSRQGFKSGKALDLAVQIALDIAPKKTLQKKSEINTQIRTSWIDYIFGSKIEAEPIYKSKVLEEPRYKGGLPLMAGGTWDGLTLPWHLVTVASNDSAGISILGHSMIFQEINVVDRSKNQIAQKLVDGQDLEIWDGSILSMFQDNSRNEITSFSQNDLGVGVRDMQIGGGPISGSISGSAKNRLSAFQLNTVQSLVEGLSVLGVPVSKKNLKTRLEASSSTVQVMLGCWASDRKSEQNAESIIVEQFQCLTNPKNVVNVLRPVLEESVDQIVENLQPELLDTQVIVASKLLGSIGSLDRLASASHLLYFLDEVTDDLAKGPKIATVEIFDSNAPKNFTVNCRSTMQGNESPKLKFDDDLFLKCGGYENNGPNWYEVTSRDPDDHKDYVSLLKPVTQYAEYNLRVARRPMKMVDIFDVPIQISKVNGIPSKKIQINCGQPTQNVWGLEVKSVCTSAGMTIYLQFQWYEGGAPSITFDMYNIHNEFRMNYSSSEITTGAKSQVASVTAMPDK